jgi:hypothetical protein
MKTPYAQLSENLILLVITARAGGTAVLRKSPVCRAFLHGGCHDYRGISTSKMYPGRSMSSQFTLLVLFLL